MPSCRGARGYSAEVTVGADPLARVLSLLSEVGHACTAADIKKAWEHAGAKRATIATEWPRVQKRLRHHPYITVEGDRQQLTYRFAAPKLPDPVEALDALLAGGLPSDVRATYTEIVRSGLAAPAEDAGWAARLRQAGIDGMRRLAEVGSELEELVSDEVGTDVVVFRMRARLKRTGLVPVGEIGGEITFDRKLHKPLGGSIRDGTRVIVVRPGYIWKAPSEDVLMTKAIVRE